MMLMATVFLAGMHSIVRYLSADLHPFVIVFFRNFFGLLAITALIAKTGLKSLQTQHPELQLARIFIGLLAMLSWFYALSRVPITNATALSFSSTIFATLAAWLILGERMRVRRWMAIFVGLVGVVVVLRPGLDGFNIYALLVIASTAAWGISITIVKKLSETDPALLYWQWPSLQQFIWLMLIGALASGGHYCMTSALRLTDTAIVMSVDFSRLIWTTIIGYIFFKDLLDQWTLVGALIIFASAWYIIFRESRIKTEQSEGPQVVAVTTSTSVAETRHQKTGRRQN